MTILQTNLCATKAWQSNLSAHDYSGFHHNRFCQMLASSHQQDIMQYHSPSLLCNMVKRPWQNAFDVCNTYGYSGVLGDLTCLAELYDALKAEACLAFYSLQHPILSKATESTPDCSYAHTAYFIDLTLPIETLENNLSSNHKRNLKKLSRLDYQIVHDKNVLIEPMLELYQQFLQQRSLSAIYHFSSSALAAYYQTQEVSLIGLHYQADIQAVLSFAHGKRGVEFFLQGASKIGRDMTRLILWEAVLHFKALGFEYLHLGGGIQDGDSLAEFKRQFASHAVPCYALKKILNEKAYAAFCESTDTRYFPAYRAPAL